MMYGNSDCVGKSRMPAKFVAHVCKIFCFTAILAMAVQPCQQFSLGNDNCGMFYLNLTIVHDRYFCL